MSDARFQVCVIGGGVSGLTTALTFLREGHLVTIIAESKKSEVITSTTAAAFWYPFWVGTEPDHSWYRAEWAKASLTEFARLTRVPEASVNPIRLIEYFPKDLSSKQLGSILEEMWWKDLSSLNFEDSPVNVTSFAKNVGLINKMQHSAEFDTYVINMSHYLPYLQAQIEQYENFSRENNTVRTSDLEELLEGYDFVIACVGLGAADLVPDPDMQGVRGVVVRMPAQSQIKEIKLIHTGEEFGTYPLYMVPRLGKDEDLILGGTIEPKTRHSKPGLFDWHKRPEYLEKTVKQIIKLTAKIEPTLQEITPLGVAVGYRPYRSHLIHHESDRDDVDLNPARHGVRLGPDLKRSRLIHNYGHGGGGVTLSWGCAKEVVQWANRIHAST